MKQPTFLEGVAVAFALSAVVSGLMLALQWIMPLGFLSRLLISGCGLFYILYLLSRSRSRTGRITIITIYTLVAISCWVLAVPIALYLCIHILLIWLVRSLYRYSSVLAALADLGLSGLALAASIAAWLHTGNLFLSLWTFFLIQALYVAIPVSFQVGVRPGRNTDQPIEPDRFAYAQRAAETAVRKLSSI